MSDIVCGLVNFRVAGTLVIWKKPKMAIETKPYYLQIIGTKV